MSPAARAILPIAGWLAGGLLSACGESPSLDEAPPGARAPARLLDEAASLLAEGRPASLAGAGEIYRELLTTEPDNSEARYGLGQAELAGGRTWAGLWQMLRLTHESPEHAGAWSAMGVSYYGLGAWADVPPMLERVATIRPLAGDESRALGSAYLQIHRTAAADSVFSRILEADPGDPAVLSARAQARRRLAHFEDAVADYRAALDRSEGRSGDSVFSDRVNLAEVLLDLGRIDETKAEISRIASAGTSTGSGTAPDSARFRVLEARVLDRAGVPEEALSRIALALAIDSLHVDALHLQARLLRKTRDREAARVVAARHGRAVAAHSLRGRMNALKAAIQGGIALEAGDEAGAIAAWEKGLEDAPGDYSLHCLLGPIHQRRGDRAAARASFSVLRQAMGGAPPGPLFLETGLELRRRGLPGLAVDLLGIAVRRMPGDERALFYRARSLVESGDREGAVSEAGPLELSPEVSRDAASSSRPR